MARYPPSVRSGQVTDMPIGGHGIGHGHATADLSYRGQLREGTEDPRGQGQGVVVARVRTTGRQA